MGSMLAASAGGAFVGTFGGMMLANALTSAFMPSSVTTGPLQRDALPPVEAAKMNENTIACFRGIGVQRSNESATAWAPYAIPIQSACANLTNVEPADRCAPLLAQCDAAFVQSACARSCCEANGSAAKVDDPCADLEDTSADECTESMLLLCDSSIVRSSCAKSCCAAQPSPTPTDRVNLYEPVVCDAGVDQCARVFLAGGNISNLPGFDGENQYFVTSCNIFQDPCNATVVPVDAANDAFAEKLLGPKTLAQADVAAALQGAGGTLECVGA